VQTQVFSLLRQSINATQVEGGLAR